MNLGVCLGVCAHSYRLTITKIGANFQFCFTLLGAHQELLEPSQLYYSHISLHTTEAVVNVC